MQDIHDKSADEKNAMDAEFNTVEIEDSDQDHKTLELFDTVDPVYQAKLKTLHHDGPFHTAAMRYYVRVRALKATIVHANA